MRLGLKVPLFIKDEGEAGFAEAKIFRQGVESFEIYSGSQKKVSTLAETLYRYDEMGLGSEA
jgi:hypothetical protein